MEIGQLIRQLRKSRRMSQMALAAHVGVSYQQIQKYEKGTSSISTERLKQIAEALGTNVFTFFPEEKKGALKEIKLQGGLSKDETALLNNFRRIKGKRERLAFMELSKTAAKDSKVMNTIFVKKKKAAKKK